MSVQQCQDCGRLSGYLPRGVCAACQDEREADFRTVRDWLRRNAGASVVDLAAATGVREPRIALFIREGRLQRPPGWEDPLAEEERRREAIRRAVPAPPPTPAPAPAPLTGGGMRARHR